MYTEYRLSPFALLNYIYRKQRKRANYFYYNLEKKSNGKILCTNYKGAKEKVIASCLKCGYEWERRADKLLERAYCPKCHKNESR